MKVRLEIVILVIACLVFPLLVFVGMRASENRRVADAAEESLTLELEAAADDLAFETKLAKIDEDYDAEMAKADEDYELGMKEDHRRQIADLEGENAVLLAKISALEAEAELRKTQERAMLEASRKEGYKKPLKFPDGWGE